MAITAENLAAYKELQGGLSYRIVHGTFTDYSIDEAAAIAALVAEMPAEKRNALGALLAAYERASTIPGVDLRDGRV